MSAESDKRDLSERALMHALAASTYYTELDRSLARLLCRLARDQSSPELMLAVLLASSQSAARHACADLSLFAGQPVDPALEASPDFPDLTVWLDALRACPNVVGSPTDSHKPLILAQEQLYLSRYWHYEVELAQWLHRRLQQPADPVSPTILPRLSQLFGPLGDNPSQGRGETVDWQRTAAVNALASRFCVISGGPGTGKTTTVAKLLTLLLEAQPDLRLALAAPTGKAAARLKESLKRSSVTLPGLSPALQTRLQELPATTLHRLLGARWGSSQFRFGPELPLPYDVILVDEASMIDLALMVKLLWAVPDDCRLILLGDKDQLASVEAGSVLGDLCSLATGEAFGAERQALLAELSPGKYLPASLPLDDQVVLLRTSWRFAAGGGIGLLAQAIQAGDVSRTLTLLTDPDQQEVHWQELPRPGQRQSRLSEQVLRGYQAYFAAKNPAEAFQYWEQFRVLAALRGGEFGIQALNRSIETALVQTGLIRAGEEWYHRRPVLISANDEAQELLNGDIGIVWYDQTGVKVWFQRPDGSLRALVPARLGKHETAWAMTIHKSQGSEFDRVLMILPENDSPLLTRELIYTGLTRARKEATIWGPQTLLAQALTRRVQRASGLARRLTSP